jgi:hypothetical protein
MEMPDDTRVEILSALHTKSRLTPETLPFFAADEVRRSLLIEVVAIAGKSPANEMKAYIARLSAHLNVKPDEASRWARFFEKLTELENRVAAALGKKGHLVRLDDHKLEIFKKAVAAVGVPATLLFPLGTVGLSADGIATGLIALGGGFLLPTGIAMVTGLAVAVALGVSSKKILDMVMPTTDADRISIDVEKINADAAEIRKVLDDATAGEPDENKLAAARTRIAEIIRGLVPMGERDRAKMEAAFAHAHTLGERYIDYLTRDQTALETRNHVGAEDLASLLKVDLPAIC